MAKQFTKDGYLRYPRKIMGNFKPYYVKDLFTDSTKLVIGIIDAGVVMVQPIREEPNFFIVNQFTREEIPHSEWKAGLRDYEID